MHWIIIKLKANLMKIKRIMIASKMILRNPWTSLDEYPVRTRFNVNPSGLCTIQVFHRTNKDSFQRIRPQLQLQTNLTFVLWVRRTLHWLWHLSKVKNCQNRNSHHKCSNLNSFLWIRNTRYHLHHHHSYHRFWTITDLQIQIQRSEACISVKINRVNKLTNTR